MKVIHDPVLLLDKPCATAATWYGSGVTQDERSRQVASTLYCKSHTTLGLETELGFPRGAKHTMRTKLLRDGQRRESEHTAVGKRRSHEREPGCDDSKVDVRRLLFIAVMCMRARVDRVQLRRACTRICTICPHGSLPSCSFILPLL
jgi:hypothetical protein